MRKSRIVAAAAVVAIAGLAVYLLVKPQAAQQGAPSAAGKPQAAPAAGAGSSPALAATPAKSAPGPTQRAVPPSGTWTTQASLGLPLPPAETPIAQAYEELRQRARVGDHRASCRLAHDLSRCGEYLPGAKRMLGRLEHRIANPDPELSSPEIQAASRRAAEAWRGNVLKDEAFCQGFKPSEDEAPIWQHVLNSALAGNVQSMTRFVLAADIGLDASTPLATPDGWAAYRVHAPGLLQAATETGDPLAFLLMAEAYAESTFTTKGLKFYGLDPFKAVAYFHAAELRSSPKFARSLQAWADSVIKKHNLSAGEVARARAEGALLAAKAPGAWTKPMDLANGWASESFSAERCVQ